VYIYALLKWSRLNKGSSKGAIVMALKKFCAKSGCHNLCDIAKRYCTDHTYLLDQQKTDRNKQYDRNIRRGRDKKYNEFYHSPEWEKTRASVIDKHNGLDLYAYYLDHRIVLATMVHHIVELKDGWDKRLDLNNLIPLNDPSHSHLYKLYRVDKQGTQEILRELIKRWNREMKG
jgi:5-methylcytosine-specific restriction endonuclease McrA